MFDSSTPLFEVTSVAVSAANRRLTTAANVRAMVGSPVSDDVKLVEPLIDRATAAMVDYAGLATDLTGKPPTFGSETCRATWFVQSNYERRDPLTGGLRMSPLRLPWRVPVTSITSVTENGLALVAGTDYQLKAGALLERLSSDAPIAWSPAKIVVVYVAGFATPVSTNVPPDLEQAAIEQVKFWYSARKRDPTIASEQVPDIYQASYRVPGETVSNLLPSVEAALASYTNWAVTT